VLEEELEAVRREVTDLQRRLGEVEDQREALEEGALAVFRVVEPRAPMRVDQLHALPEIIRSAVRLGIHRGAAAVLVSVQLRTGMHLGGIDPGFPETSSVAVRWRAMLDLRRRWTLTTSCSAARTRSWTARSGPTGRRQSTGLGGQLFILFNYEKYVSVVPQAVRAAWVNIWGIHHVCGVPNYV